MSESAAAVPTRRIDWQEHDIARAMLPAESPIDSRELSSKNYMNFSLNTSFRDASKTQARNPYSSCW